MSIYDDFAPSAKNDPIVEKIPPKQEAFAPPAKPGQPEQEQPRRRGCGCGSCLLALLFCGLACIAICVLGGFLIYKNRADLARNAVVSVVEDSDLSSEDKESIIAQVDRVRDEYKAGRVSDEQLGRVVEEFFESPLFSLLMAYAAMESYVEPSGLSDDEKGEAQLAFARIARGVFEEQIEPDQLDPALDHVSETDPQGNRQFKSVVSDEELRAAVAECQKIADDANLPMEEINIDIGDEFKKIVDEALSAEA